MAAAVLVLVLALLGAGCGLGEGSDGQPGEAIDSATSTAEQAETPESSVMPSSRPTTTPPTSGPTTAPSGSASTDPPAGAPTGEFRCGVIERFVGGDVQRTELIETSGLAASLRHAGTLWATNDSGQRSGVYAIDQAGSDLGFFALVRGGSEISTVDVEDLAIGDGVLYLADIGDNNAVRDTVAIHMVTEPVPGQDGTAEVVGTITVRYPDGPTDAEALILDPVGNELIILSKDLDKPLAPTTVYTVALPARSGEATGGDLEVEAVAAAVVDVAALTASSDGFSVNTLLFPGSVTAADLSPAGDLIALRTYGSVWLFPRQLDQSVADALGSAEPCEAGSAGETQGEALTFLTGMGAGTIGYVTVSEGENPPVNVSLAAVSG